MLDKMNDPDLDMIRNKFFKESLMGIAVFGVPAFSALILGRYLDKILQTNKVFTLVFLILAFVSSWVLILYRNKRITKEYRDYRATQKSAVHTETETPKEHSEHSLDAESSDNT